MFRDHSTVQGSIPRSQFLLNPSLAAWALAQSGFVSRDVDVCALAARRGNRAVVESLVSHHGFVWGCSTCAAAARAGQLECLRFLRDKGCAWDRDTASEAAAGGHLPVLEWVVWNGCDLDVEECITKAGTAGHAEVVRWLEAHRAFRVLFILESVREQCRSRAQSPAAGGAAHAGDATRLRSALSVRP
jgi:hypothetical protein